MVGEEDRMDQYMDLDESEKKTEKQRQGNEVKDFNDLPKEAYSKAKPPVPEPEPEKPSPSEIIDKLYEEPPKPTFDPTIPEYQKRSAKLNAYNRGLSTLADAFTVGVGGNVVNQGPDRKTGKYIDNYFKYLDDYRRRQDEYDYRDWLNRMRGARTELAQANRDQSREDTQAYRDQAQENWQKSFDASQGNREQQQENWDKRFDFSREQWEKQPERQKELYMFQESLRQARKQDELNTWLAKETAKLQFDKEKNKYLLYDNSGKPRVAIDDEGQIQKLYHVITSDPEMKEEADAMMEILKAQLGEGISMSHMKIIVSKLWDRSEQAKKFLGLDEQQTSTMSPQEMFGEYEKARSSGQNQPEQKAETFDYSNINY